MQTILVVANDELARQIRSAHYEIITVGSAITALDVLDSKRIDLLLADLEMPRGQPSGLSLARMALMRQQRIKVILMTGYNDLRLDPGTVPGKIVYKPLDLRTLTTEIGAQLSA
jgi:DNA-binding NtrC family response regulator